MSNQKPIKESYDQNTGILGSLKVLTSIFLENTEVTEDGSFLEIDTTLPTSHTKDISVAQTTVDLGKQRAQDLFAWIAQSCDRYKTKENIEDCYQYYSAYIDLFARLSSQDILKTCYRIGNMDISKYVQAVGVKFLDGQSKETSEKWKKVAFNAMAYNIVAYAYYEFLDKDPFVKNLYSLRFPKLGGLEQFLFDKESRSDLFKPSLKSMLGLNETIS